MNTERLIIAETLKNYSDPIKESDPLVGEVIFGLSVMILCEDYVLVEMLEHILATLVEYAKEHKFASDKLMKESKLAFEDIENLKELI